MSKRFWSEATDETWRALIEEPLPPPPTQLTRRNRFFPVSADRDGDVAGVLFARRGVSGAPGSECWLFDLRDGPWVPRGRR